MISKRRLREALYECAENPKPWPDPRFFAAAPTRDQAKLLWWNDLKKMIPRYMLISDPSESALTMQTVWGAMLHIIGLDKPQRMEGVPWDGGVISEFANCKPGLFDNNIRPALADRRGWCWFEGVPDRDAPGQIEYKRRYEMARSGRDPDWSVYHWPSSDILPADEIEAMRRSMDDETFRQEVMGEFILAGGLAFPTFNYETHVRDVAYDPALPLCWALDFNVDPMCSGVIQHHAGKVNVLREIILHDSDTNSACEAVIELAEREGWSMKDLRVYGDPTGRARDSTSGRSDWSIVKQRMGNYNPSIKVPKAPWPIKDTLNALRGRLRTADGDSHLTIDKSCRQLVRDFESLLWPSDMSEGHAVAWLRYFCAWEYPIRLGSFEDMMEARVGSAT